MEKQNEISPVADESVKTETKQAFELFPKLQLRNPWLTLASVLIAAIGLMLLWWKSEGAGLRWPLSVLIVGGLQWLSTRSFKSIRSTQAAAFSF